jgi:hypothetical protein
MKNKKLINIMMLLSLCALCAIILVSCGGGASAQC